jgi:hypothetical protein
MESAIKLALTLAEIAAKLLVDLKKQSGMTDDQLLALAESQNAEARERMKALIAGLPQ